MKKFALVLSVLALAVFGLAACGDDDDQAASEDTTPTTVATETTEETGSGGATGSGATLAVSAVPDEIAYEQSELTAPEGDVTVEFDNPGSIPHDVVIEDADGNEVVATDVISDDQTTATGKLAAGDYTFYCSVDGHREQGMEGPLTVE